MFEKIKTVAKRRLPFFGLPKDPVVARDVRFKNFISSSRAMLCMEATCGAVFQDFGICPCCGGSVVSPLIRVLSGPHSKFKSFFRR